MYLITKSNKTTETAIKEIITQNYFVKKNKIIKTNDYIKDWIKDIYNLIKI